MGQNEYGDIPAYQSTWDKLQTVGVYDELTDKTIYRATQYSVK